MWFEKANRTVARTHFSEFDLKVSTVFLGLDHNYGPSGPPILFETMTFGPPETVEWPQLPGKRKQRKTFVARPESDLGGMDRYATWDEAIIGHGRIVGAVRCALERKETSSEVLMRFVINKASTPT